MLEVRWATALAVAMVACAPSPGDCPSPEDCACPCSNEAVIVCDQIGTPYLNQCMLECDGRELGTCDGDENPDNRTQASDVDCEVECAGAGTEPVCGAVGQGNERSYVLFDNPCLRDCLGASAAPDKKCE